MYDPANHSDGGRVASSPMRRPRLRSAGGVRAILYTLRKAWQAGGWLAFYRRMRTRNACKTCALGMGGQQGGMTNEAGHFPEVCKKSVQAQAADMQAPIAETFFQNHRLDALSRWSARELEYAGRLSFPLFAGPDDRHYRRVSWEEALDRVVARMKATSPERAFFYASGRASNEAAFLLQCLARAWGSNHVNNCSYYCHQASGVGLSRALGTGTGTVSLDDLGKADFVLLIGANPASNHPRLISQLVDLRARGGQVLVVNPLKELGLVRFRVPSKPLSLLFGSRISDLYLQPRVGGDIALLKGMLKHLIEADALDRDFLTNHTTGWSEVEADARHAIFLWAMGITHHAHGVQNVLALVNLAAARGMLGRPGAGLCPIRGHSNVQGVGSVGFAPALKKAFASALEQELGLTLPTHKGFTTYEAMVAAEAGGVDFAFLLGGNLYASNPDLAFAGRALRRIGLTVYVSTKLNQGHFLGRGRESLILPALARDEERQATTQESMFNFVRLSDGGAPSPPGTEMKSEVEIVAALAARLLPPSAIPWTEMTSHAAIRRVIARVVPGYGPMAAVNQFKREFVVEGRVRHAPDFATSDGRVRCFVTPLPGLPEAPDEFALMTIRSEGQFNTVVYEEEDIYRGQERRDVVLMNAEDAGRLGLREDQPLRVESEAGVLEGFRLRYADLARGAAAMYYPEANVVVPRRLDPESGTPAFKSARVRIRPLEARPARVA